MRCLISESHDPYFNLASEEYLLKNSQEDVFMLYLNEPCIVVGKHQNLLSEINLAYVLENKIKLARRVSGGGTVYQDLNNVNFCFIQNCQNIEKINFEKFTFPILNALNQLNLNAKFSERHDILIDNQKVSGNAMHVNRNRVLSHGTLLYRSDLAHLSQALKNNSIKYSDKSIKSVKSKVTNINTYLKSELSTLEFCYLIFDKIELDEPILNMNLSRYETTQIELLANEKFSTWEWIYGYSPKYIFKNCIPIGRDTLEFQLNVMKGVIKDVKISGKKQDSNIINKINSLVDVRHDYYSIHNILKNQRNNDLLNTMDISEFCSYFF